MLHDAACIALFARKHRKLPPAVAKTSESWSSVGMAVLERKATFSRSHRKARLWRYCATAAIVLSQVAAVAFVGSVQAPRTPLKVQTCALSGPVGMTVAVLKEKLRERGHLRNSLWSYIFDDFQTCLDFVFAKISKDSNLDESLSLVKSLKAFPHRG